MIRTSHIPKGKRKPLLVLEWPDDFNEGIAHIARLLHVGAWSRVTLTHAETGDLYIYELTEGIQTNGDQPKAE